ncbi:hypothetical protein CEXT_206531 [Caerostris extrusa]|uniref:Uncharacterized protein n=1 Tax=Caerostris extrusa TaxID=172846 RepID=A0AAV4NK63_CAEEX|nr:hypothetical protein CEXT_206531 [Caerostris extrusa]
MCCTRRIAIHRNTIFQVRGTMWKYPFSKGTENEQYSLLLPSFIILYLPPGKKREVGEEKRREEKMKFEKVSGNMLGLKLKGTKRLNACSRTALYAFFEIELLLNLFFSVLVNLVLFGYRLRFGERAAEREESIMK